MSSTNRNSVRSPNDFYLTDPKEIVRFLLRWRATDPVAEAFFDKPRKILDPSAGGLTERVEVQQKGDKPPLVFLPSPMSYPTALKRIGQNEVDTLDIRENSLAAVKGDFLQMPDETFIDQGYEMLITNPPFSLAIEFIQKSLRVVKPGGYVVMLLRLNFFESETRKPFFDHFMPSQTYVHRKRLGFTPDGKTDSIPYQHCIFTQGQHKDFTELRIV